MINIRTTGPKTIKKAFFIKDHGTETKWFVYVNKNVRSLLQL